MGLQDGSPSDQVISEAEVRVAPAHRTSTSMATSPSAVYFAYERWSIRLTAYSQRLMQGSTHTTFWKAGS